MFLTTEMTNSPNKSQIELSEKQAFAEPPQIKINEVMNTENDDLIKSTNNMQGHVKRKKSKNTMTLQIYPYEMNSCSNPVSTLFNAAQKSTPLKEKKPIDIEDIRKKIKSRLGMMIHSLPQRKVKSIQAKQFNMIDDWASSEMFYKQEQLTQSKFLQVKRQIFSTLEKQLTSLSKKYPPLNPSHPICNLVRIANFILSFLIIFCYSLQTFLKVNFDNSPFFEAVLMSGIILFSFDIVLNFNIGYYSKGGLVLDRYKIYKNYKWTLVGDLLSMVSLTYNQFVQADDIVSYILKGVFLIKLFSMEKQKKRIENLMIYKYGMSVYYTLLKLLFGIMWKCHWISLFWYFCAKVEIDMWQEQNTWLHIQQVFDKEWYIQYIYSYFWAAQTVITGGNFQPQTSIEVAICIIFMLGSVGLFAFIINRVGQILEEITQGEKQYQKELEVLNKFVRNKNLSKEMQERVLNYLEFQYIGHQDMIISNQVNDILKNFPKNIKEDMKKEICYNVLRANKIFRQNFSSEILNLCTNLVEEEFFMPGDLIVSMNQHEDISLYIIFKGSVEISLSMPQQDRETFLANLPQGASFGIQSFFSGLAQNFQAKSLNFTTIYKLKRSQFLSIIQDKQEDFEKFCQIKDTLLTTGMCLNVYESCKICNKFMEHNDQYCDLVHYAPNKRKLIYKIQGEYNQSQDNRLTFERKEKLYFSAISIINQLSFISQRLLANPETKRILVKQYKTLFTNTSQLTDSEASDDESNKSSNYENNNSDEDGDVGGNIEDQEDTNRYDQQQQIMKNKSPNTQAVQQQGTIEDMQEEVNNVQSISDNNEKQQQSSKNIENDPQNQQQQIQQSQNKQVQSQYLQGNINFQIQSARYEATLNSNQQTNQNNQNKLFAFNQGNPLSERLNNYSTNHQLKMQVQPIKQDQQAENNQNQPQQVDQSKQQIKKFSIQINNKISDSNFKIQQTNTSKNNKNEEELLDSFSELDQIYIDSQDTKGGKIKAQKNLLTNPKQRTSIAMHFRNIEKTSPKLQNQQTNDTITYQQQIDDSNPQNQDNQQQNETQSPKKQQKNFILQKKQQMYSKYQKAQENKQHNNFKETPTNNSLKGQNLRKCNVFRPIKRNVSHQFDEQFLKEQVQIYNKSKHDNNKGRKQSINNNQDKLLTIDLQNNNQLQLDEETEISQADQDQFILDFECRKSFCHYFNQQNFSQLLQAMLIKQKEKFGTQRKLSKITPINVTAESQGSLIKSKLKKKTTRMKKQ